MTNFKSILNQLSEARTKLTPEQKLAKSKSLSGRYSDKENMAATKKVYAFIVLTDSDDNRFFLNKTKNKFIKFNPKQIFSVEVGEAKDYTKMNPSLKKKIFDSIPDEINGYDKYQDNIEVMDSFELEGAPASWQASEHSNFDD